MTPANQHVQLLATAPCICTIIGMLECSTSVSKLVTWLILRVAAKRFAFGKHIYIFNQLGAMNDTTGFLHTLYFFQIFFNLATGVTKLTMYVTRFTSTHQTGLRVTDGAHRSFRLAFYRRIFPVAELKRILLGATAVVLLYTVAFTSLNIFQWYVF